MRFQFGGVSLVESTNEVYLELIDPERAFANVFERHHLAGANRFQKLEKSMIISKATPKLRRELLEDNEVKFEGKVLRNAMDPKQTRLVVTDKILIRVKKVDDPEKLAAHLSESYNLQEVSTGVYDERIRVLEFKDPRMADPIRVANKLKREEKVESSYPDIKAIDSLLHVVPNDPYFIRQWALQNIGQAGIAGNDAAVAGAWELTKGSSEIRIGILDTGCDPKHPDLRNKYVDSQDAVRRMPTQSDDHGHGTCCAGIAAAMTDNAEGVAGIAWECPIIPVKTLKLASIPSELCVVDAIDWAVAHGARVINMSWFWPGPHTFVDQAISRAYDKNVILVAAAGNSDIKYVTYPASNPMVIGVGASNEFGERKSKTSQDGEKWWGSNYGDEILIYAPGVHIWTTDISGAGGYTAGLDYYDRFNCTSAAAPHVAGAVALMLSRNPALSQKQVRKIIVDSSVPIKPRFRGLNVAGAVGMV